MNLRKMKKAGVVSQSTQMIENVQDIMNILMVSKSGETMSITPAKP